VDFFFFFRILLQTLKTAIIAMLRMPKFLRCFLMLDKTQTGIIYSFWSWSSNKGILVTISVPVFVKWKSTINHLEARPNANENSCRSSGHVLSHY